MTRGHNERHDVTNQVIPDAAVEAAAISWAGQREWLAHSDEWRNDRREDAKSALEAAAPHMESATWNEGYRAGQDDAFRRPTP